MAVVQRGAKIRPMVPVGYERVSHVRVVTEDVQPFQLLVLGPNGWSVSTAADPTAKRGFAAQAYAAGRRDCSIFTHGEADGFVGLTPGQALYPAAAGGLETVAVAGFVGLIHAISPTAIEFTL